MKTTNIFFFLLSICLLNACKEATQPIADLQTRTSVTFIVGKDKSGANPFYQAATDYYCNNPTEKTDELVLACHSLGEMTTWLQQHHTANGQPYGIINIVVHGNPWVGCRIGENGKRVDSEQIEAEIDAKKILPLSADKFDAQTEIRLLSCGLGQDKALLKAIGQAFAGSEHITVRSPLFFMVYEKKTESKRSLAEFWHIAEKENMMPAVLFQQNYPNISIAWEDALTREKPRFEGDTYLHAFAVPFRWTFILQNKSEIPAFANETECKVWLANQADIQAKLKEIHFEVNDFHWQYWAEYEGDKLSFKVKGLCNVACVLRTLDSKKALDWEDESVYCTIRL